MFLQDNDHVIENDQRMVSSSNPIQQDATVKVVKHICIYVMLGCQLRDTIASRHYGKNEF